MERDKLLGFTTEPLTKFAETYPASGLLSFRGQYAPLIH